MTHDNAGRPVAAKALSEGLALSPLTGKVALVTGAGRRRSIGRSIAESLAAAGADIVVTSSGRASEQYPAGEKAVGWRDAESVADNVRAMGRRAMAATVDVTDEHRLADLAQKIRATFGRLDIIVNSAGAAIGTDRVSLLGLAPAEWRRVIDVNLTAPYLVCHALGPLLIESGPGGSIINISSVAAKRMSQNAAAYVASKAGLNGMTGSLARELGEFGIRVNAILPGLVETSRTDTIAAAASRAAYVEQLPVKRVGAPDDIANLAVFLCTDQASWITGQMLCVDGGQVIQP